MIGLAREVILFIAASLDGYIAKKDDNLDWLLETQADWDNGYNAMYDSIDTVIMGRKTYDYVVEHSEQFAYSDKQCYVYSNTKSGRDEYVEFVKGDIVPLMNKLKAQEGKDIWLVGGGELIIDFIQNDLIDEYRLFITPHLLGEGIPLFKSGFSEKQLNLIDVKLNGQFVEMVYRNS
jgi:dihydrofolate reductase